MSNLLCTGVPHSDSEDSWSTIPQHTEKFLSLLLTRLQHDTVCKARQNKFSQSTFIRAGIADTCMGMPWTNVLLWCQSLTNTCLLPWWERSQLFDLRGLMVVAFLAKQNLAAHPLLRFGRITESRSTWHNMVKVFHILSRDGLVVVSILTRSNKGGRRKKQT